MKGVIFMECGREGSVKESLEKFPTMFPFQSVRHANKWLIIQPEQSNWMVANLLCLSVLQMMDGSNSLADIISLLKKKTGSDSSDEVFNLYRQLKSKGFLASEAHPGISPASTDLLLIYLHVTTRCNLKCAYCYAGTEANKQARKEEMNTKEIIALLEKLRNTFGESFLVITGGEPLLRKDLGDIITAAKDLGINTTVSTNGTLITRATVDRITAADSIQISLDGSCSKIHNRQRASYDRVWRGINLLLERGIVPAVTPTLTRLNHMDAAALFNQVKDLGMDITFNIFEPFGKGSAVRNLGLTRPQVLNIWKSMKEISRKNCGKEKALCPVNYLRHISFKRHTRATVCGVGKRVLSIAPNGDAYPCNNLHVTALKLGNVLKDSLETIRHSPVISRIRVPVDKIRGCKKCPLKYMCAGGCRSETYWRTGTFTQRNPYCKTYYQLISEELLGQ